jgi:hypothetical protein
MGTELRFLALAQRAALHLLLQIGRKMPRCPTPSDFLTAPQVQMSDTHQQVGETYEVTHRLLTEGTTSILQKVQLLGSRFWATRLPSFRGADWSRVTRNLLGSHPPEHFPSGCSFDEFDLRRRLLEDYLGPPPLQ